VSWGALYYPPVLTLPPLAREHGWSVAFAMAGFSLAILVAGATAPKVGRLIDLHGGHRVLPAGSLLGALGLVALTQAQAPWAYFAAWAILGLAMAASLYDPAFATLGRIFGAAARQPITALTLVGGFASTVSWPATAVLLEAVGWRGTYWVYAAVLAGVSAPLQAFALPRGRAEVEAPRDAPAAPDTPPLPRTAATLGIVMAAFASYAFIPSGLLANLLAMLGRLGVESTAAVAIGLLFGPAQVAARLAEFVFARAVHPVLIARFAVALLAAGFLVLMLAGFSAVVAALFMVLLGVCNGLLTIARGTVPLALFGPRGYGALVGRIAGPALVVQSAAPFVVALAAERFSDFVALALVGALTLVSLGCFFAIRPSRA
jgi:MFS family permease